MFEFLKNLIPVSRKRYNRDQEGLLVDVKRLEDKKFKLENTIKENNSVIKSLDELLKYKNSEIEILKRKVSWSSELLEKRDIENKQVV
ncbi:hypothetical protein JGS6364_00421 [[Clostridium] sordellii]|uniref:Uncharacterized protein n=1 Tax=Paraclostridium sordellii TaxID=1505 RepID=A0ABM9RQC1_PARSO|nr:hypothetical protein [Paeniclostridium sordellii]EPZ54745.1 hypothetical protein H477_3886 [[Clostridium] sordellii ATCC 9714] [Paeniclostridium sordellii ATCC 9714]CEJ74249.1 hypothetical protein ATCC9714_21371 [[Clostridium] sordellii] [Paeniclostridium sordellii]CEK29396.1 hypothetical protein JGS6364_00421 [[Clostridium] sordellii] [Paeniclostridium sordellii]CEN69791.1 Uncharacterised protein [[Clostridium] sordellii] [Paeniclostridium sordellii]CEN73059.1 Uncharacterised protein [[Clo